MDLSDLANHILQNPSSLFIGAGCSMDAGGPSGKQLIRELKEKFGDLEAKDFFRIL